MSMWGLSILCSLLSLGATLVALPRLVAWLQNKAILDLPNERSSHALPVPRGGGLAVVAVVLPLWLTGFFLAAVPARGLLGGLIAAAAILAFLSWRDDLISLSARLRFAVQGGVVLALLLLWPSELSLFQGSQPLWLDRLVMGLAWLWFLNLYNFMDGIDGISGVETVSIGAGLALCAPLYGAALLPYPLLGGIVAASALGFLRWNWHPARVFLGDVGSVPLGLLLGGLLLLLACEGAWLPALLLPAYYLMDASLTLGRRWLSRENVAQAHRTHFYQLAVHQGQRNHGQVSRRIAWTNGALVLLALAAGAGWPPVLVLLLAFGMLMMLMRWMKSPC